ncbi:MAG: Holliday junction resolvase RuvX [Gemmatimonadota bacterium]|nr:MAG: Holliday junction resolvase RuvX [Gemmatimonadota bacterium]
MSRILGLDYGERRIGMAVSDPTRTIAQPLPTVVRRRRRRPPFAKIIEAIEEWEIDTVVVGLPLELNGEEGPPAETVREFGRGLERRAPVTVEYWDERLSSVRARRELAQLDEPVRSRGDKERLDAMAAVLILQSYLDAQHGP